MIDLCEKGTFRNYTVLKKLGEGGTGVVWLVQHGVLDSYFAIKTIDPQVFAADAEAEARFYREVKIAANVCHPALVRVYDAGRDDETGLYYLVMDYLRGGTLADRLKKDRRLSVDEAVRIVGRIAEGLAELHRRGIVHRDVKPSNILLDGKGKVFLSDPGIARVASAAESHLTQRGFALGTPAYMPFEQIVDSHCVDGRADIHALGITLFELLTGTRPFDELSVTQLLKLRADGVRIPDVRTVNKSIPDRLAAFIARMTEPDVEARVKCAEDVISEMGPHRGRPARIQVPERRRTQSTRWWMWLLVAALVVILALLAVVAARLLPQMLTPRTILPREDNSIRSLSRAVPEIDG